MNTKSKNDSAIVRHLEDDDLISYLDGELPHDEQEQARLHLESCWSCRTRLSVTQSSVEDFMSLKQEVLLPRKPPPSGPTTDLFHHRLAAHINSNHRQPHFVLSLSRVRSYLTSFTRSLSDDRLAFMTAPVAIKAYVFVLAAAIIAVVIIRSNRIATVSANELIQRAADAQAASVRATSQPVVHQKLHVRAVNRASEESVNWEVWHDLQNARFRSVVVSPASGSDIVGQLTRVLQANQMDPRRPLSAASYQSWRSTLAQRQEEVTRTKLSSGVDVLTLHTVPAGTVNEGQIAEAELTVRATDWGPIEQKLNVKADGQTQVYELSETESEVVSLSQVSPAIFGAEQTSVAKVENKVNPSTSPGANVEPAPLSPNSSTPVASADLEVEVLRLLHEAGADLGEQISATRGADGLLHVTGIVDTAERKAEIIRALQPVANNPAVHIEIQTVAEAVEQEQKRNRSKATRAPMTEQNVESGSETIATASELRRHFASDEQLRQFSAHMVNQSANALRHVGAIRRLLRQFSSDELRALTPEARNKWLSLIRSHALAYQTGARAMRGELRPVFFPGASEARGETAAEITDDASLMRAADRLFELATANDSVIRAAFTVSSASSSAISSFQFWQSMKSAESLAARIARAR